jgi:YD repeat-containing protein
VASIATPSTAISTTYDPAGNRATMTAAGKVTTYTYDTANRLASVSRPDIGTFGFTYNPDGQLLTITRPNGVTSTQTYDTAGRLTGLTYKNSGGTTVAAYAYTLDNAGNRTGASSAAGTDHYSLDTVGRLTGVTYADGTVVRFTYDATGNRTAMTAGADQLSEAGPDSPGEDSVGAAGESACGGIGPGTAAGAGLALSLRRTRA